MTKYQVIDSKNGDVIATYYTRHSASRRADHLDLEYGSIRYSVKRIEVEPQDGIDAIIAGQTKEPLLEAWRREFDRINRPRT